MADFYVGQKSKGNKSELLASNHLIGQGYKIISKNFRSLFGEIDIIALKKKDLYFCEVKARWNDKYGDPKEAVDQRKLNKIIKTINYFMNKNSKYKNFNVHILVISQKYMGDTLITSEIIDVD